MSLTGYGERYLQERDFLTLCDNCEVKILSSSVDTEILKEFERLKILTPNFIINQPKCFVENSYKENYDYNPDLILPPKYQRIKENIGQYLYWHLNNQIYHPFDKKKIPPFVRIPGKHAYLSGEFKISINGKSISLERNLRFYSYWKIYPLVDMINACTLQYYTNIFNDKNYKQLCRKTNSFPNQIVKRWLLPFSPKNILDEYEKWTKYFDFLSFYVQSFKNIHTTYNPIVKELLKIRRMKPEKYNMYIMYREKRVARIALKKFNIEEDKAFDFLKYLTHKYFEYKNQNKEKLSECIQKDVLYFIKFINTSWGYEHEYIFKKIGRVRTSWYFYPLEYIVEGKLALARQYIKREIEDASNRCFKEMQVPVEEQTIERFIKFCKRNYLSAIYSAIYDVNSGKQDYVSIINNLTLLAMNYERFIKSIYKLKATEGTNTLFPILKKYFKSSGLLRYIAENKIWSKMTEANNIELSSRIKIIEEHVKNIPVEYKEIISALFYTGVIRNYMAHYHDSISFIELSSMNCFNKIIGAYWYSWVYAEKNYTKNIVIL